MYDNNDIIYIKPIIFKTIRVFYARILSQAAVTSIPTTPAACQSCTAGPPAGPGRCTVTGSAGRLEWQRKPAGPAANGRRRIPASGCGGAAAPGPAASLCRAGTLLGESGGGAGERGAGLGVDGVAEKR